MLSRSSLLALFTFLLLCVTSTTAQTDRGSLTGRVTDPNGAGVANAKVTATNLNTGESREATTSDEGNYTIPELKADPKSVPALAYLGVTYAERGEYEKAIGFYEQAIARNAKLAALHYLVAETLLKTSTPDTARAEKYLKRATELDPNLAAAYLSWGRLYVRANRYNEAAPLLERAVALQPELVEAHYQLSRVLVKLKRTAEADRELAIFKQLSEKQKVQNENREIVRRLANVRF